MESAEHCERFYQWLIHIGNSAFRAGIVYSIAEKMNILMPGVYDSALYDGRSTFLLSSECKNSIFSWLHSIINFLSSYWPSLKNYQSSSSSRRGHHPHLCRILIFVYLAALLHPGLDPQHKITSCPKIFEGPHALLSDSEQCAGLVPHHDALLCPRVHKNVDSIFILFSVSDRMDLVRMSAMYGLLMRLAQEVFQHDLVHALLQRQLLTFCAMRMDDNVDW